MPPYLYLILMKQERKAEYEMKRFLKVAILLGVATLLLCAWSLRVGAAGRTTTTNGPVRERQANLPNGVVASADPRGSGTFRAVAAVSANDMWAVGSGLGTLTEHWNGTEWSLINSPSPGSEYNDLNGVAAVASNDVWAVGSYSNNPQLPDTNTLIEHWNGTKWSVITSPSSGELDGVAVFSATDAWTVGWYGSFETLTEHWNGTNWSVVKSPNPGGYDRLSGVAVVPGSTQVWAEGIQAASTGNYQILTELYC